jgi:hypothetical protein
MTVDDLPDLPLDQALDPPVRRYARHPNAAPAPGWVAPLYLSLTVLLVPWIVYLGFAPPEQLGADGWRAAWIGFDIMEAVALALTARLAYRRSTWVDMAATATGVLLIVDAWFDVMTADAGWPMTQAILAAALLELPLAVLSLWIARNAQVVNETVTRWLIDRSSRQAERLSLAVRMGFIDAPSVRGGADGAGNCAPSEATVRAAAGSSR